MTDSASTRYRALQRRARADRRATDELLTLYALEGFLVRLAASRHRDTFVLKGGMLLAALDTRRPTRDIDMQALDFDNDVEAVVEAAREVLAVPVDDGLFYEADTVTADVIRDDDGYHGVRVSVASSLSTARMKLLLDISVGDPIAPRPIEVQVSRLLDDEPVEMLGYPLPMVLAEKGVTAVERGQANTRWRDFCDLLLLSRRHEVVGDELAAAVTAVADYREAELAALDEVLDGYGELNQARWSAWVRKQQMHDRLPDDFATVVAEVAEFIDPALFDEVRGRLWQPGAGRWH